MNVVYEVNDISDLIERKSDFGAKLESSTMDFFRDSEHDDYYRVYEFLRENPHFLVENDDDGVRRVKSGKFGYLTESLIAEFLAIKNCDLFEIKSNIIEKGYGIAMRQSKYYEMLEITDLY